MAHNKAMPFFGFMKFRQLLRGIFFNKEKPAQSWLILTVAAILIAPLLLSYPVGIISAFFLNEPAAVIFSITVIGGTMLLPTILYIGVKAHMRLRNLITCWIILLVVIAIPSSIAYGQYQKTEREEILRGHIPAHCGKAEVLSFDHFLGDNFDREAFSSVIFRCGETAYDFGMKFSHQCDDVLCNIQRKMLTPASFVEDSFDLLKYVL